MNCLELPMRLAMLALALSLCAMHTSAAEPDFDAFTPMRAVDDGGGGLERADDGLVNRLQNTTRADDGAERLARDIVNIAMTLHLEALDTPAPGFPQLVPLPGHGVSNVLGSVDDHRRRRSILEARKRNLPIPRRESSNYCWRGSSPFARGALRIGSSLGRMRA